MADLTKNLGEELNDEQLEKVTGGFIDNSDPAGPELDGRIPKQGPPYTLKCSNGKTEVVNSLSDSILVQLTWSDVGVKCSYVM